MRKRKVLGVMLIVVLTASLVAAAEASADELTAESYPALLSGRYDETALTLTTKAGKIVCKEATYSGTLSAATTSVSVTPVIPEKTAGGTFNCFIDGFIKTTIHMNGCSYTLGINGGAATNGAPGIACPGIEEITVTVQSPTGFGIGCTIHIRAQTFGSTGATYVNLGSGTTREVTASASTSLPSFGLTYTQTKGVGTAPCESNHFSTGAWATSLILKASKESDGTHVGLFLS